MFSAISKGLVTLAAVVCFGSSPCYSQSIPGRPRPSDFEVTTQHIDEVRAPKSPDEEFRKCLKDNTCSLILSTVAQSVGIPPNALRIVSAVNLLTGGPGNPDSEEARYTLRAVPGYKICRVHVVTTSVVPASGDRASFFAITARPDDVQTYTWTPHQGLGGGRSWWEGNVFVTNVKANMADFYIKKGKCTALTPAGVHFECRGRDACGSADL